MEGGNGVDYACSIGDFPEVEAANRRFGCEGCGGIISDAIFVREGKLFCSEGCRCASAPSTSGDGPHELGECFVDWLPPCLHCDLSCPHLPTFTSKGGMQRNKFGFKKFFVAQGCDANIAEAALGNGGIGMVATLV